MARSHLSHKFRLKWIEDKKGQYPFSVKTTIKPLSPVHFQKEVGDSVKFCRMPIPNLQVAIWQFATEEDRQSFLAFCPEDQLLSVTS